MLNLGNQLENIPPGTTIGVRSQTFVEGGQTVRTVEKSESTVFWSEDRRLNKGSSTLASVLSVLGDQNNASPVWAIKPNGLPEKSEPVLSVEGDNPDKQSDEAASMSMEPNSDAETAELMESGTVPIKKKKGFFRKIRSATFWVASTL